MCPARAVTSHRGPGACRGRPQPSVHWAHSLLGVRSSRYVCSPLESTGEVIIISRTGAKDMIVWPARLASCARWHLRLQLSTPCESSPHQVLAVHACEQSALLDDSELRLTGQQLVYPPDPLLQQQPAQQSPTNRILTGQLRASHLVEEELHRPQKPAELQRS